MTFLLTRLNKLVNRSSFSCGNTELDTYFQRFASQDMRNGLAVCYAAIDEDNGEVVGYFTLSASALDQSMLKADQRRGRYPLLPVALLGRLAVSLNYQGQGFGSVLVAKAMQIASENQVGCAGLIVNPKDNVVGFYESLGFETLTTNHGLICIKFFPKRNFS